MTATKNSDGLPGLNLTPVKRLSVNALVEEFRDVVQRGLERQGLSVMELLNTVAPRDADNPAVSYKTAHRLLLGNFTVPPSAVSDLLLNSLPDDVRRAADERLDLIRQVVTTGRKQADGAIADDASGLVTRLVARLETRGPVLALKGRTGAGRRWYAERTAAAFAARWHLDDDRCFRIDCYGRDSDLTLSGPEILGVVLAALGGDVVDAVTAKDRAREIYHLLRVAPAVIVLDSVADDAADLLFRTLTLPPGRSRVLLTTSPEVDGRRTFALPPYNQNRAEEYLADNVAPGRGLSTPLERRELVRLLAGNRFGLSLTATLLNGTGGVGEVAIEARELIPALREAAETDEALSILVDSACRVIATRQLRAVDGPLHLDEEPLGEDLATLALATIAYAPSDLLYADIVMAVAAAASDSQLARAGNVRARHAARVLLRRMEQLGLLARVPERSGGRDPRPSWTLAHPLLRTAARTALGRANPGSGFARAVQAALLDDLIRRASAHAHVMSLPVAPWPIEPATAAPAQPDWYTRHADEIVTAVRRAARWGHAEQACRLTWLIAGYLQREARWIELDHVTKAGAQLSDQVDPTLRVCSLMLRGIARHHVYRAYGQDGQRLSRRHATAALPSDTPKVADEEPGARGYYLAARQVLGTVKSAVTRQILDCWLSAHELRSIYSEVGPTIAASVERVEGLARTADECAVIARKGDEHARGAARAAAFAYTVAARTQRRMGVFGGDTAQVRGALDGFRQAGELWALAGDLEGQSYARMNQSRVLRIMGGPSPRGVSGEEMSSGPLTEWDGHIEAEELAQQALEGFIELGHLRGQADAHNNLGRQYRHCGRNDRAFDHFTWAAESFNRLGDDQRSRLTRTSSARTAHEGGYAAQAAMILPNRVANLSPREAGALYVSRARVLLDLGRYEEAELDFQRAHEVIGVLDDYAARANLLHNWALLQALMGGPSGTALSNAARALELHDSVFHPLGRVYTLANLAQTVWRKAERIDTAAAMRDRAIRRPYTEHRWAKEDAILLMVEARREMEGMWAPHASTLVDVRFARYVLRVPNPFVLPELGIEEADKEARRALEQAEATNHRILRSPRLRAQIELGKADLAATVSLSGGGDERNRRQCVDRYEAVHDLYAALGDPAGQRAALHRAAHAAHGMLLCPLRPMKAPEFVQVEELCDRTGLPRPACIGGR